MYKLKKGVLMFKNNIINYFKKGNNLYNKKGITLIALVITIIIMLLLASIAIQLALGDNRSF